MFVTWDREQITQNKKFIPTLNHENAIPNIRYKNVTIAKKGHSEAPNLSTFLLQNFLIFNTCPHLLDRGLGFCHITRLITGRKAYSRQA